MLQDIPSGLWELHSSTEPASPEAEPEQGCITPQAIASDLQELVEQVQAGQVCSVQLPINTPTHGQLVLRCERKGSVVMQFTRPAEDRVQVKSQLLVGATGPHIQLVQDYRYVGACPK